MRGVIFTEFTAFLEGQIGADALERAIQSTELRSGGAYTSVGSYPYSELEALLKTLVTQQEGLDATILLYDFGMWLAGRFQQAYKDFFDPHDNVIDFLNSVDGHIHVEVRKLNPDAVPPRILMEKISNQEYRLRYQSHRPLAQLALGLTNGAVAAYGDKWRSIDFRPTSEGREMTLTLVKIEPNDR